MKNNNIMGKKAKEHRKKIQERNRQMKAMQRKISDIKQMELLRQIENEKQAGLYDNKEAVVSDDNTAINIPKSATLNNDLLI